MHTTRSSTRLFAVVVGVLAIATAACSSDTSTAATTTAAAGSNTTAAVTDSIAPTTTASPFDGALSGKLGITPGACSGGTVSGSYFRMVAANGTVTAGPFIPNADSACADTSHTLLTAGTDGGLVLGTAQAAPDPAFDATGNGLSGLIVAPAKFFGVAFAVGTDAAGKAPTLNASSGALTGDLSAFTAYYATGVFNQGAPKPDGSGTAPTGTIDPATGHYTLEWTSLISGGSFNGFTGVWHLEGTFTPKG